jgi:hypothetical protein
LDVPALPASIRAEHGTLPVAVKGHATAQAGPRLAVESIAAALRAPFTLFTISSEADRSENVSAFVTNFGDKNGVLRQQITTLRFTELHGRLPEVDVVDFAGTLESDRHTHIHPDTSMIAC